MAGVGAPQLLGHRRTPSAQDALAEEGHQADGRGDEAQRPLEVGGAKADTGCGRPASVPHVGAAHAVG